MSSTVLVTPDVRLSRIQYVVLLAVCLGWMFDGYEANSLILTAGPAMKHFLPLPFLAAMPHFIGLAIAIQVLGWALGGIFGGILADRVGRTRALMISIGAYAAFSALTAMATSWQLFDAARFLTGLGIGAEWAGGAALLAEAWPDRLRSKGAAVMQASNGAGFLLAALIWFLVGQAGPDSFRYMFLVGILPAIVIAYIRRRTPESEMWMAARRNDSGVNLIAETIRTGGRRFWLSLILSVASIGGFWAISSWIPYYVTTLAGQHVSNMASILFQIGSVGGLLTMGLIIDSLGRKWTIAVWYAFSLVMTPIFFYLGKDIGSLYLLALVLGFFIAGQFAWCAVYLPELFATRVRGTAIAFAFNLARLISAAGPLVGAALIVSLRGVGNAATVMSLVYVLGLIALIWMPETRSLPLPQ